jgi:hypothetical protein
MKRFIGKTDGECGFYKDEKQMKACSFVCVVKIGILFIFVYLEISLVHEACVKIYITPRMT